MIVYKVNQGVKKLKSKTAIILSTISLGVTGVAMALVMPLGAKAVVGGPVCSVGPSGDYSTIQAAVNDPGCSTINVAPGVYAENVVIDHSLTLNGAQAGNAVSSRTPEGAAESTVSGVTNGTAAISIRAADVTVDGFSVTNSRPLFSAIGIGVKTAGNNAVITNNIIDTINTADTGGNGTAQGVYLEGGPDGVSITDNQISNVQSVRSSKAVLLGDNGATNAPNNTLIQGNTFSNITSTTKGAYGVSVANITGGTSGLQIKDNTLSSLNGGGWVHAIGLEGNTPSVVITGNTISNLVSGSPDAIAVWFESENTSFATGSVHNNNFNVPATTFGIAVDPALSAGGSVSGTCNWWNSATGPTAASNPGGTGAQVSPNVTYAPWLVASAPGGDCFGGNVPTSKDQCKKDGWMTEVRADGSTFKNQGDCVSYVATGGRH